MDNQDSKENRAPGEKGETTMAFGRAHDDKVVTTFRANVPRTKLAPKAPLERHHTAQVIPFPGLRAR